MLNEINLPKYLWANIVNTNFYVMDCVLIQPILKQTSYELYKWRNPNISHLHVFGCKCFIHNNEKDNFGKFDVIDNERISVGHSTPRKDFRVYNKRTKTIEESFHVTFDESNPKTVEVEVINCAGILERAIMEDNQEPNK